jgi:hypothetical protein
MPPREIEKKGLFYDYTTGKRRAGIQIAYRIEPPKIYGI